MNYPVTMKYKKKIRLLVTNHCSRNCSYCHNEGMSKLGESHLVPNRLEPFLSTMKAFSNKIVISGGEPFEYKYLEELVDLLANYGFDISLITANVNFKRLEIINPKLKSLHFSIHDLNHIEDDFQKINLCNLNYPNLNITLNVPFDSMDLVISRWDYLYQNAKRLGANIQFIHIFSLKNTLGHQTWNSRWDKFCGFLETKARFMESTEREFRFITEDEIKIDLLDIPCLASGIEFENGSCLTNSDITIDPSLNVSICRWTNSSVSLISDPEITDFKEAVKKATVNSCKQCIYGEIKNYYSKNELLPYANMPHYIWPRFSKPIGDFYSRLSFNDLSYYGKSGNVLQFENHFANYLGVKFTLAVNSGTSSILLAVLSLGLSGNDEIILPAATFPTLIAAILAIGIKIKLCDINSCTGLIDVEDMNRKINTNTKAVLVTHLWGMPADMPHICKICHSKNISVIEDASHAYGALINGKKSGAYGDIACFSMQANKSVYAGEGGIFATSNQELYERAVTFSASVDRIIDCVKTTQYLKYWATGLGSKLKVNPLGIILALNSLSDLDDVNNERNMRMNILEDAVRKSLIFVPIETKDSYYRTYYTFKLVLKEEFIQYRDEILQMLIHYGLDATLTSFLPVYQHQIASDCNIINAKEHFSGAETYYNRIISIPAFIQEPIELVEMYAETIIKVSKIIYAQKQQEFYHEYN